MLPPGRSAGDGWFRPPRAPRPRSPRRRAPPPSPSQWGSAAPSRRASLPSTFGAPPSRPPPLPTFTTHPSGPLQTARLHLPTGPLGWAPSLAVAAPTSPPRGTSQPPSPPPTDEDPPRDGAPAQGADAPDNTPLGSGASEQEYERQGAGPQESLGDYGHVDEAARADAYAQGQRAGTSTLSTGSTAPGRQAEGHGSGTSTEGQAERRSRWAGGTTTNAGTNHLFGRGFADVWNDTAPFRFTPLRSGPPTAARPPAPLPSPPQATAETTFARPPPVPPGFGPPPAIVPKQRPSTPQPSPSASPAQGSLRGPAPAAARASSSAASRLARSADGGNSNQPECGRDRGSGGAGNTAAGSDGTSDGVRQQQQSGGLLAAGGGGGDEPYAHIIFRQSSTDVLFYPNAEVAKEFGDDAATRIAGQRIAESLKHYEEDGARAARQAWGAPLDAQYTTYIAFGSATGAPSDWTVAGVPLPPTNTGRAFLRALPTASRIVIIGVDGVTDDPMALYDEFATQLEPDTDLVFTSGATAGPSYAMTAEELCIGLEAKLELEGEEGEDGEEPTATFETFFDLLVHGNGRRWRLSDAARDHRGEAHRASRRRKRRSFPRPDDAPRKKHKTVAAEHEQPSNWDAYWRCGRNGCPYVGSAPSVERHREADKVGYIYCFGKCPIGCILVEATIDERRAHVEDEHPDRFLCSFRTCGGALSSSKGRNAHEDRHTAGTIWPNGMPAGNMWTTLERALSRPVLPEQRMDGDGSPNPFFW